MQTRKTLGTQPAQSPAWRRDYVSASAIERGLALKVVAGVAVAAQYLHDRGIPFDVVYRILVVGVCRANDLGAPFVPRRYVTPTPLIYSHSHPDLHSLRSREFHAALKSRERAGAPDARANAAMAAVIDSAIAVHDQQAAALYMHQHRVPFNIIVRVLAGPQARRGVTPREE